MIEMYWGKAKRFPPFIFLFRFTYGKFDRLLRSRNLMGTMKELQDNLAPCLDEADLDKNFFKRIHNRSLRYMDLYDKGATGVLAAFAAKTYTRHRSVPEGWLSAALSAEYTAKFDEAPQKSIVSWQDESNAAEKHCESDTSGDDDDDGAALGEEEAPPAPVFETVAQGRSKRRRKPKKSQDMVVQSSGSDASDEDESFE